MKTTGCSRISGFSASRIAKSFRLCCSKLLSVPSMAAPSRGTNWNAPLRSRTAEIEHVIEELWAQSLNFARGGLAGWSVVKWKTPELVHPGVHLYGPHLFGPKISIETVEHSPKCLHDL